MTYLKYTKRVITMISLSALTMGITGCDRGPKPVINPHPKYFVTVSGNIQPHMPYPMTIMLKATYAAYHPSCGVWVNQLEGVRGLAGHADYYPAHPDANGNYSIKIPIDRYQPGKCDWKIAWVMLAFTPHIPHWWNWEEKQYWGDMMRFGQYGSANAMPGLPDITNATFYCGKGGLDLCNGTGIVGGPVDFSVSRKKSYHFIQNIRNKGD